MRLLANPVLLRAIAVLFCSGIRLPAGIDFSSAFCGKTFPRKPIFPTHAGVRWRRLPLNLYNTVIQQLKQQKHELQVQSQAEQHRARTS